jgi:hypothetical protein
MEWYLNSPQRASPSKSSVDPVGLVSALSQASIRTLRQRNSTFANNWLGELPLARQHRIQRLRRLANLSSAVSVFYLLALVQVRLL